MHERLAVATAPQADTQPERQPARQGGAERLLALQLAGPAPARALQRCGAGGCTCGGACGGRGHDEELEDELRMGAQALQRAVADRRMIAREQDPGPPQAPDMQGLGCGFNSKASLLHRRTPARARSRSTPRRCRRRSRPRVAKDPAPGTARPSAGTGFAKNCCRRGEFFNESARKCATSGKEQPVPIKPSRSPVGAPAAVVTGAVRRPARAGAAPEGRLPAAEPGPRCTPELGELRRELAPDQRDHVDVAVQQVLAHHARHAGVAQRAQLLGDLVDRAGDPRAAARGLRRGTRSAAAGAPRTRRGRGRRARRS